MNPDVEALKQLATEWDGQAPAIEEPPAIDGAAANAAEVLSKQILEGDRRIKAVPRSGRAQARKEILETTVAGYQVVRFLFWTGHPSLDGNRIPQATQTNMSRIMTKGHAYSDEDMAEVLRCRRVAAHAKEHGHLYDQSGPLGSGFGDKAKNLRTFAYMTGMRIGLAEEIEFGPFPIFGPEA
jgi:hypothetical protein